MVVKGDKKHVKCIYLMRMRNPFSLCAFYDHLLTVREKRDSFDPFLQVSKQVISLVPFIQILFV